MTTLYLTMFAALVYTHVRMKFPGQGSLEGYSPRGCKSWTWLSDETATDRQGKTACRKAPQPRTCAEWTQHFCLFSAVFAEACQTLCTRRLPLAGGGPPAPTWACTELVLPCQSLAVCPWASCLTRLSLRLVTVSFLAGRAGARPRRPERPALTPRAPGGTGCDDSPRLGPSRALWPLLLGLLFPALPGSYPPRHHRACTCPLPEWP